MLNCRVFEGLINSSTWDVLKQLGAESKWNATVTWILICLVHSFNVENHSVVYKMKTNNKCVFVTPIANESYSN